MVERGGVWVRRGVVRAVALALGLALSAGAAGCRAKTPAQLDTDGDGVPDSVDKCPADKEDGQDPDPNDGCPKGKPLMAASPSLRPALVTAARRTPGLTSALFTGRAGLRKGLGA